MILFQPTNRVVLVYSFTCQAKLSRYWPHARPDNRLKITPRDTGPLGSPDAASRIQNRCICSVVRERNEWLRQLESRNPGEALLRASSFLAHAIRGDCACLLWGGIGQIKSVEGTITSCLDGNNANQGLVLAAADQRIRISFEFLLDRRLVLELKYLPVG